ncbi:PKD domain-containing protein [Pseudoalteromonas luteoviolacea]|uniref:PKD/Chitinase domain-containing protein n=1 Tax=Pseudoalteromonas luteoviolacea S4054 TaxID=1129367 RepID=A0A0F6A4T7_9GAMM|nr:carboxypeptidase-like regulatory domain-containing protein [Pseudoalteromonas luteoviolacea]AOT08924.1 hypothetical protein S4054249_14115 [Pseudoalteromonas luteoviolacea]AOT13836.1 hypothetical protein S40542_14085 [Pseudoalteromonas luteoviolacea]AOT18751.1 hypothetical protein S4054_14090 [Pseudoalteromonas luteoviolacea]KKE80876.1 hypothetical protein N479_04150 [Pseudoalteromonas luteoviolacea S4054]KZN70990.1 hypothetical protein N481_19985 [Pseudoalteromonas luteoviolacea S4047-1]
MTSTISKACLFAFTLLILGCGGSSEELHPETTSTENPAVTPDPEPQPEPKNQAPIVGIEGTSTGQEQQLITLIAKSSDTDGSIVSYQWQHDSDLVLDLSGEATERLMFSTPDIQQDVTVTFTVTVTDNQGASASASHIVQFARDEIAFQLRGLVTDQPIPNAIVTATVGKETFSTTANTSGAYTLDIAADAASDSTLVQLHAQGVGAQSRVEFMSQLPSVERIRSKIGEDNILDASEVFGVNVTNVTTAEYVQLSEHEGVFDSQAQLQDALLLVDTADKIKLATLIKALVDDNIDLMPAEYSSTLALAEDAAGAEQLYSELETTRPELLKKAEEALLNDATLLPGLTSELLGDYTLAIPNKMHSLLANLSFNDDGTGQIVAEETKSFDWEKTGQMVTLSFAEPVTIVPAGIKSDYGPSVKTVLNNLTIDVLEERDGVIGAYVSYQHDLVIEFLPEPITTNTVTIAHLYKTLPDLSIRRDDLYGVWSLQHHILGHSFGEVTQLELFEDGTARQASVNTAWQWHLDGNTLVLTNDDKTLAYQILEHANGRLNAMVIGHISEKQDTFNGAIFVKHQAIDFDTLNFTGSWSISHSQYDEQQYFFFENNSYFSQLGHVSVWALEQGKLELGEFLWNGTQVSHCDLNQVSCQFRTTDEFELIGVYGDDIVVNHTKSFTTSVTTDAESQSLLRFFTIASNQGQFLNKVAPYMSKSTLYSAEDTLTFKMHCPGGPCYLVAEYQSQTYRVEEQGSAMLLSNDDTGEQLVLSAKVLSATELEVCIRTSNGQCDASNTSLFSTLGPELDFKVIIEGEGSLVAHTDKPRFGEVLSLTVIPSEGYIISEISGCNGYFEEQSMKFEAYSPTMSCHITAKFIKDNEFVGDNRLVRKGFYAPSSFDFNIFSSGNGVILRSGFYPSFTWQTMANGGLAAQFDEPTYAGQEPTNSEPYISYDIEITGFELERLPDGVEVTWHRQLSIDGVVHSTDSMTEVFDDIRDFEKTTLTHAEVVGTWSLGYGSNEFQYFSQNKDTASLRHLSTYELILNQHGDGEIIEGQNRTPVNWVLGDDYIELQQLNGHSHLIRISLWNELDGGFKFSTQLVTGSYMTPMSSGTGVMVKHRVLAPEIISKTGAWRFKEGSHFDTLSGLEVYDNGVTRLGADFNYHHSSVEDNIIYMENLWDYKRNIIDPNCSIDKIECSLHSSLKFELIATGNKTLYVLETSVIAPENFPSSILRVIEYNPLGADRFERYMLANLRFNQLVGDTKLAWRTEIDKMSQAVTITTPEGQFSATLDEQGRIVYDKQGESYYLQVVTATSGGIKVCHYSEHDVCNVNNELFLTYQ